jgi:ABC-type Fe3+ transport system substrate-binding protein
LIVACGGNAAAPSPTTAATPTPTGWAGQKDWDALVAAAKQEGRVTVVGPVGDIYRLPLTTFSQAYPEITVEFEGINGSVFTPQVAAERAAGKYLHDLIIGSPPLYDLKASGTLDPLKPVFMLPDVVDSSKWLNGVERRFTDIGGTHVFAYSASLAGVVYVNRDFVPDKDLSTFDQLLDARWRGKIAWIDPTSPSGGQSAAGHLALVRGEEFLTKLLKQDVVLTKDLRQAAEWVVRGTYPIVLGANPPYFKPFQDQGLGKNIKALATESEDGVRAALRMVGIINKAPHPNAAKLYINWLLSKDAQLTLAKSTTENSARLDVKTDEEITPDPKRIYRTTHEERYRSIQTNAGALAKKVLGL